MQVRLIRMVVLVIGLGLATTACGKYSLKSIRSAMAFKDGIVAYQKSEYLKAAGSFEEAVTRNPDYGLAYFFLGNSYDNLYKPNKKGEAENDAYLPKAVAAYRRAVETLTDPNDPFAAKYRKLSYEYLIAAYGPDKINDFAQAEPIANELIRLEPNEPGNYQALGRLFEEQGRYDEAEPMFKKAMEVKPNDPLGYQIMAGYYDRQGEFDKMIDAFTQRANMEPNNPDAWHTMGTYYFAKVTKDKKIAKDVAKNYIKLGLEAEDKALAVNPIYVEALTYKQLLMRYQANFETDPAVQKKLLSDADAIKAKAAAEQAKLTTQPAEKEKKK